MSTINKIISKFDYIEITYPELLHVLVNLYWFLSEKKVKIGIMSTI